MHSPPAPMHFAFVVRYGERSEGSLRHGPPLLIDSNCSIKNEGIFRARSPECVAAATRIFHEQSLGWSIISRWIHSDCEFFNFFSLLSLSRQRGWRNGTLIEIHLACNFYTNSYLFGKNLKDRSLFHLWFLILCTYIRCCPFFNFYERGWRNGTLIEIHLACNTRIFIQIRIFLERI